MIETTFSNLREEGTGFHEVKFSSPHSNMSSDLPGNYQLSTEFAATGKFLEDQKIIVESSYQISIREYKKSLRDSFISLNKWEGIVTDISKEKFTALLLDLKEGGAQEMMEFLKEELSDEDLPLLRIGAVFYWNIGYETINGQRRKSSLIRFRRLPDWTQEDWDGILDHAQKLKEGIVWE